MNAAINTFIGGMTCAVSFAGFQYASHGHISWWFLVGLLVWGIALGLSGFSAGWEEKGGKRRPARHQHTWGKWQEREATARYLGMGAHAVTVQVRYCETCGLMDYTS